MVTRLPWEQKSQFKSDIFNHLGTLTAIIKTFIRKKNKMCPDTEAHTAIFIKLLSNSFYNPTRIITSIFSLRLVDSYWRVAQMAVASDC